MYAANYATNVQYMHHGQVLQRPHSTHPGYVAAPPPYSAEPTPMMHASSVASSYHSGAYYQPSSLQRSHTYDVKSGHALHRVPTSESAYSDMEGDSGYEADSRPSRMNLFHRMVDFTRGRSKSRGHGDRDESRSRSRPRFISFEEAKAHISSSESDRGRREGRHSGSDRERREREKQMRKELDQSLLGNPMAKDDRYKIPPAPHHPRSEKEEIRRAMEEADRQRRYQEKGEREKLYHSSSQPHYRPSSRSSAFEEPEARSCSPTLKEHTQFNARQLGGEARPHSRIARRMQASASAGGAGYQTDVPAQPVRRMAAPVQSTTAPPGWFNARGDQLIDNKGGVLRVPAHMEFPKHLASYPAPGTGWQDHLGQLVGPDLRWVRKIG